MPVGAEGPGVPGPRVPPVPPVPRCPGVPGPRVPPVSLVSPVSLDAAGGQQRRPGREPPQCGIYTDITGALSHRGGCRPGSGAGPGGGRGCRGRCCRRGRVDAAGAAARASAALTSKERHSCEGVPVVAGTTPHRAGCCGGGARGTRRRAGLRRRMRTMRHLGAAGRAGCSSASTQLQKAAPSRHNEACRSSSAARLRLGVFSGSGLRESRIRAEYAERLSSGPISKAATIATRNQAARPISTHHHGLTLPPRGYLPCSHVLSHRVTF